VAISIKWSRSWGLKLFKFPGPQHGRKTRYDSLSRPKPVPSLSSRGWARQTTPLSLKTRHNLKRFYDKPYWIFDPKSDAEYDQLAEFLHIDEITRD
jgi:hypothetical protein